MSKPLQLASPTDPNIAPLTITAYLPKFSPNKGQSAQLKKAESLAKIGKVMNA